MLKRRRVPMLVVIAFALVGCEKRINDEVRRPAETTAFAAYVAQG